MEHVYMVVLLALIEYMVFGALVGRARNKYNVKAPAVSGPEAFDRTFRVHQNTLEFLIVFIPAIVLFGRYQSANIAALIGLVAIVGRAIYAIGYIKASDKRGLGAMISGIASAVLVVGALTGVIAAVL
ncbi:MAG: MAPEG family protein [Gammaproteobacteria bacterium]|nr:MAPEG family protein [Gammaproteobacteria bacterium]